jgi:hypothetical protein
MTNTCVHHVWPGEQVTKGAVLSIRAPPGPHNNVSA